AYRWHTAPSVSRKPGAPLCGVRISSVCLVPPRVRLHKVASQAPPSWIDPQSIPPASYLNFRQKKRELCQLSASRNMDSSALFDDRLFRLFRLGALIFLQDRGLDLLAGGRGNRMGNVAELPVGRTLAGHGD